MLDFFYLKTDPTCSQASYCQPARDHAADFQQTHYQTGQGGQKEPQRGPIKRV